MEEVILSNILPQLLAVLGSPTVHKIHAVCHDFSLKSIFLDDTLPVLCACMLLIHTSFLASSNSYQYSITALLQPVQWCMDMSKITAKLTGLKQKQPKKKKSLKK